MTQTQYNIKETKNYTKQQQKRHKKEAKMTLKRKKIHKMTKRGDSTQ